MPSKLIASFALLALATSAIAQAPPTPKRLVTDTYHGTAVADDYRWLENPDDPEVKAWSDAQNTVARAYLDALPNAAAIRARVEQIMTAPTVRFGSPHMAGKALLAMRSEPTKQQAVLVSFDDAESILNADAAVPATARVVLDPTIFDPSHKTTIDWYVPSPDGKLVAVSLSSAGSESGDVHLFTLADGKPAHEIVPRVNGGTAGGSLAWAPDSSGYYYTRYPRAGERPSEDMDFYVQVYYHTLGEATEMDRYELGDARPRKFTGRQAVDENDDDSRAYTINFERSGRELKPGGLTEIEQGYVDAIGRGSADKQAEATKALTSIVTAFRFPRVAEIVLQSDERGRVLATVQDGDGGYYSVYLRDGKGVWSTIARYSDRVVQAVFGPNDSVYMVSRKNAPRGKLLRLSIAPDDIKEGAELKKAKIVVSESSDTLVSEFAEASNLLVTDKVIYATYQLGGPSELRAFSHDGKPYVTPVQPPVASVGGLTPFAGDDILFSITSYVQPQSWYITGPAPIVGGLSRRERLEREGLPTESRRLAALSTTSPAEFSSYEAVREMATSKDGTKVPVNIIRKKGLALDGSRPTVLSGYGGYGVNIEPGFSAADIVRLEQGFVLAEANIRGGGEFGEAWHVAGNLTNKQNVFDDFAAAAQLLIDRKYTSTPKLAIEGGSNGGLLMGAELTQHPAMFKCVVSHVGIYDMLRVELSSNGAFNVPEFGTVKDKAQFDALYAYSPYHHVKDNTPYPAVLFLTGANDPRVDPMQSRKMTARLQAALSPPGSEIKKQQSGGPILLRTSGDTGHGAGTPLKERIAQNADVDAFLFQQLGVEFKPVSTR